MPPSYAQPLHAAHNVRLTTAHEDFVLTFDIPVDNHNPYMAGHFPGLTMLPAVFLLEGIRQAVNVAFSLVAPVDLTEMRSVRLIAPMLAGDIITITARVRSENRRRFIVAATCRGHHAEVARVQVALADPRATSPFRAPLPVHDPVAATGSHARIRGLLPLRHPMLLVDAIGVMNPHSEIRTTKSISAGEQCYANLPDGLPEYCYAFPRSLLFESFGQSAALLWLSSRMLEASEALPMLAAIRGCRFGGSVFPGETVQHVVRLENVVGTTAFLTGEIWTARGCLGRVESLIAVSRERTAVLAGPSKSSRRA